MQELTLNHEKARCAQRRERKQEKYVGSFRQPVLDFLVFAPAYAALAEKLADAVALHATPIGSGTVAQKALHLFPDHLIATAGVKTRLA